MLYIDVRASENQGFSRIAFVSCIIQRRSQDVEMRWRGFTGVGYLHAVFLRNTSTYISVWFKKSADSDAIVPSNTSWLRRNCARLSAPCLLSPPGVRDGTLRSTYSNLLLSFFPFLVKTWIWWLKTIWTSSPIMRGAQRDKKKTGSPAVRVWYDQYICDLYL